MDESKTKFIKFLDLCRTVTNNDTCILTLLQQRYDNTNPHFLWSENFCQLIEECSKKIHSDPQNKFVHIQRLVEDLKSYKAKPLKHLLRGEKPPKSPSYEPIFKRAKLEEAKARRQCGMHKPLGCQLIPLSDLSDVQSSKPSSNLVSAQSPECCVIDIMADADEVEPVGSLPSQPSTSVESTVETVTEKPVVTEQTNVEKPSDSIATQGDPSTDQLNDSSATCSSSNQHPVSASHVKRLEKLLQKLSERIQRLEERELSLDDLDKEDSAYLLEERYKKKFMLVWGKLCELTGNMKVTGRESEKLVRFQGTKYEEANRKISRYVNINHAFPDYQDVLQILTRCNQKYEYNLKKASVESLARDAFSQLGSILQARRIKDYVANLGCSFTDKLSAEVDPALNDVSLKEKLENSRREGLIKIEQVINTYADKQATEGDATDDEDEDDDDAQCSDETDTEVNKSINETDLLVELEQDLDNVVLPTCGTEEISVICVDDETASQEESTAGCSSLPVMQVTALVEDSAASSVTKKNPTSCDPDDVKFLRQMTEENGDSEKKQLKTVVPVASIAKSIPSLTPADKNGTEEKTNEVIIEIDDTDETVIPNVQTPMNVQQVVALALTQHNRDTLKTFFSKALEEVGGTNMMNSIAGKSVSPAAKTSSSDVDSSSLPSADSARYIGRILNINSRLSPLEDQIDKSHPCQSDVAGSRELPRSPLSSIERSDDLICEEPKRCSPSRPPRPTCPSSAMVRSRVNVRASNSRSVKRHVQDLYEISSQIVASVMQSNQRSLNASPCNDDVIICDDVCDNDESKVTKAISPARKSPGLNAPSNSKARAFSKTRDSDHTRTSMDTSVLTLDESEDVVLVDYVDAPSTGDVPSHVSIGRNGRSSKPPSIPIGAVSSLSPVHTATHAVQGNYACHREQGQSRASSSKSMSSRESDSISPVNNLRRHSNEVPQSLDNSVIVLD